MLNGWSMPEINYIYLFFFSNLDFPLILIAGSIEGCCRSCGGDDVTRLGITITLCACITVWALWLFLFDKPSPHSDDLYTDSRSLKRAGWVSSQHHTGLTAEKRKLAMTQTCTGCCHICLSVLHLGLHGDMFALKSKDANDEAVESSTADKQMSYFLF